MVQIIPTPKAKQSTAQRLIGGALEMGTQMMGKREQLASIAKENEQLNKLTGMDMSGINDPEARKMLMTQSLQGQNKDMLAQSKLDRENQEKLAPLQSGLSTIEQMRNLRSKGNLGRGSGVWGKLAGGDTARQSGEYEQLGKSLISLATNIPIRNRIEFETLAEKLYDPTIQDAEAEGILNAMERIIKGNMGGLQNPSDSSNKSDRPPLSSFNR